MRNIDLNNQIELIIEFIRKQLFQAGFNKIVVGLSGGIDSSVTAALSVKAIGKENVFAVMLPYHSSHPDSLIHAIEVAESLDIKYEIVNISQMVDAYFKNFAPEADILRKGNRMARERMCVLYDRSAKNKALVAGTGNLSEIMIGYCTQYGDSACAFEPIGHLYKTEIYKLAEILKLPESVIKKKPTADLWEGQTDEEEMGITYKELDEILFQLLDEKRSEKELISTFGKDKIHKVKGMIQSSEFKRIMPPMLK
ncbi:MAG: NAD+ synthase [Candidatus Tenebribacter burtonii]|nr:NAD+ synthase [Candidatus Tenebribacter burtonii]